MRYFRLIQPGVFGRRYVDASLVATDDQGMRLVMFAPHVALGIWILGTEVGEEEALLVAKMFGSGLPKESHFPALDQRNNVLMTGLGPIETLPPLPPQVDPEAAEARAKAEAGADFVRPRVRSSDWKHTPVKAPQSIPPPQRLWSQEQWEQIRLGHKPLQMEDHWFGYVVGTRLHFHRSWTGYGIYEARFRRFGDHWGIEEAHVSGLTAEYRRSSDRYESLFLRVLIADAFFGEYDQAGWEWLNALREDEEGSGRNVG
jgi:hypothetical protein